MGLDLIDRDAEILFNREVARDTFLMGLQAPQIAAQARPGQFVMVRVRAGMDPLLRRPFSICGTTEGENILILYRVVGTGTSLMSGIGEGNRLAVLGPLGRGFEMPGEDRTSLLVAGGMGVAPLIFLSQEMEPSLRTFMAGYGTAADIVPVEQIAHDPMGLLIATDDGSFGHKGPVTDLLEIQLTGMDGQLPTVFTCGPPAMLKRIASLAAQRGFPCQASLESNMACGLGACLGCAVRSASGREGTYDLVCRDGPVFPIQSVDWGSL